MHEMSLVHDIVDVVLAECVGRDVKAVAEVHLTIGEMGDVVERYIPEQFRYLARETVAADARIVIARTPVIMRCKDYCDIFALDLHDETTWACPRCGKRDHAIFSGNESRIDQIIVREGSVEACRVSRYLGGEYCGVRDCRRCFDLVVHPFSVANAAPGA